MNNAETAPVKYASVNGAWPQGQLPKLTDQEAIEAVRRLYRKFMGRKCSIPFKITHGNRITWPRRGVFYVNPDSQEKWGVGGGWHDLVHHLSHYVHWRTNPKRKPHGLGHAWIEREMIEHIVKSGWLDGKLKRERKVKPAPTADELAAAKLANLDARIKRWETKRRRAETALAKLNRQRRRLAR